MNSSVAESRETLQENLNFYTVDIDSKLTKRYLLGYCGNENVGHFITVYDNCNLRVVYKQSFHNLEKALINIRKTYQDIYISDETIKLLNSKTFVKLSKVMIDEVVKEPVAKDSIFIKKRIETYTLIDKYQVGKGCNMLIEIVDYKLENKQIVHLYNDDIKKGYMYMVYNYNDNSYSLFKAGVREQKTHILEKLFMEREKKAA